MCLYTKKDITAADEPVTCWKFVEVVEGITEERITVTPYTFVRIPDAVLEGIEPFKADKSNGKPFKCDDDGEGHIASGYIHTFGVLDLYMFDHEAEFLAEDVGKHDEYVGRGIAESIGCRESPKVLAIQLWRCEIPAGTPYFEGEVEANNCKGYASDEIVFKEMILEISEDIAGWEREDERRALYKEQCHKAHVHYDALLGKARFETGKQ